MTGGHQRLIEAACRLYERAVMYPEAVDDTELAEWAADQAELAGTRDLVRSVRRIVRRAGRLAAYWAVEVAHRDDWSDLRSAQLEEWMARVDEAAGIPAWRELLDVASSGIAAGVDGVEVSMEWLFPLVNQTPWPGLDTDD